MQAQNAQKLDEIRHTVDEQLQEALQKRVTESFKAVNDQLEQVYKLSLIHISARNVPRA